MRRAVLLSLALIALLVPAARAATRSVDLPQLFATQLERSHAQTTVPILLPQTLRSDFKRHFPEGRARPDAWRFDIGAVRDCHTATACFIAEFTGVRGGRPSAPRAVRLARGRTGFYRPSRCGASCAPPSVEWRERRTLYTIEAKTSRRELVRMANSAIRNGPR
jgi:hypothetical protein